MNRASLRNEGKVHLGLVYANDTTLDTGRLQLRGALSFYNLLQRWTGCGESDLGLSHCFDYLVANDSLRPPVEIAEYYERINAVYLDYLGQEPALDYLGRRPEVLAESASMAELAAYYDVSRLQGGFHTAELAIDPEKLARIIRNAVQDNRAIQVLYGAKVEKV